MTLQKLYPWVQVLGLAAFATQTQGQTVRARSELRRTVDPSERSITGDVILQEDSSGKQTVLVQVRDLGEPNYSVFLGDPSDTFATNVFIHLLEPLAKFNVKTGAWRRELVGSGVALLEFQALGVNDISSLAGGWIAIGKPGEDNVVQNTAVTNVVNGVTNIINGSFIPIPEPNVTNIELIVAWAPIPALSANPSAGNFVRTAKLTRPGPPNPSPNATGTIRTGFNNSSGESVFEIKVAHMVKGQTYSLWIANAAVSPTEFIKAGDMTQIKSGSTAKFVRDTKFGDPLPQEYGDVDQLSGRIFQIRDAFDTIHLEGVIP